MQVTESNSDIHHAGWLEIYTLGMEMVQNNAKRRSGCRFSVLISGSHHTGYVVIQSPLISGVGIE